MLRKAQEAFFHKAVDLTFSVTERDSATAAPHRTPTLGSVAHAEPS